MIASLPLSAQFWVYRRKARPANRVAPPGFSLSKVRYRNLLYVELILYHSA